MRFKESLRGQACVQGVEGKRQALEISGDELLSRSPVRPCWEQR